MREKRKFGERSKILSSNEPHKKYFLIYEGEKTEVAYFETLEKNKHILGISALVELISISRSYSEAGWSNPQKLLEGLLDTLKESSQDTIKYNILIEHILGYFDEQNFFDNDKIQRKKFFDKLKDFCKNSKVELSSRVNKSELEKICSKMLKYMRKFYNFENYVINVKEIVTPIGLTYKKNFDKICFIIDRDQKSFTEQQYSKVLTDCRRLNFGFYLSNPCFEFWLLLHFPQSASLSEEEKQNLILNSKNGKYTYAEQKLREVFPHYQKTDYDVSALMTKIDVAIANEKLFCEDEEKLKNELGSRVGLLISEMRSTK